MKVSRKLSRRSFLSAIVGVGAVATVGTARAYQDNDSGPGADPVGGVSFSRERLSPNRPSESEMEEIRREQRERCVRLRAREEALRAQFEAGPEPSAELREELDWVRNAIRLSCSD